MRSLRAVAMFKCRAARVYPLSKIPSSSEPALESLQLGGLRRREKGNVRTVPRSRAAPAAPRGSGVGTSPGIRRRLRRAANPWEQRGDGGCDGGCDGGPAPASGSNEASATRLATRSGGMNSRRSVRGREAVLACSLLLVNASLSALTRLRTGLSVEGRRVAGPLLEEAMEERGVLLALQAVLLLATAAGGGLPNHRMGRRVPALASSAWPAAAATLGLRSCW